MNIKLLKGLLILFVFSFIGFYPQARATSNACVQLGKLFHEKFECCGTGEGFSGCARIQNAYQATACGVLSCERPVGTIVYKESFNDGPIKIYDIFSDSVFDPSLNGHVGTASNTGEIKVINGEKIVFIFRSILSERYKLLIYDIPTATLVDTGQFASHVSIEGDIIAFSECPPSPPVWCTLSLKYYDISTGLTTDTGDTAEFSQISGDHIVTHREGPVRFYKISTGETTFIRTGQNPAIDGDIISFSNEGPFGPGTIMYYRISTGQIVDTGVFGYGAAVSGDQLAFAAYERYLDEDLNGDRDKTDNIVLIYDISTGTFKSTNITTGTTSWEMTLSFDKNIVAIKEKETGNIFIYDVLTDRTIDTGISGFFPSVEGK